MDKPVPPGEVGTGAVPSQFQWVLYETARVLAESATLTEAAPPMLGAICKALGWQYGALWEVDRGRHVLHVVAVWQPPSQPFADFAAISQASTFAPGVGLPGRVWASGEPVWIPDVTQDENFPRGPFAERVGLHAAFGLPIRQRGNVVAVMEFFNRDILQPSPDLLTMITTVGSQLGVFVERRWADEELDRFFTLSLDLFCVATLDGYFVRVNPAWQRVLGFSDAELCASPFVEFVHPDDRAATLDALSGLTTGTRVIDFENRYRARDGSYKWLQWTATPYPMQGLVYATARDVTDRKAANESLQVYARELDIARQEALRAANAKSEFLANMSHEIRTPLNVILGMTELTLQSTLAPRQRDHVGAIHRSAEALLTIINDILDVSKVEAGHLTLDRSPFDLRDAVEDGVRLLAPRAVQKGLELACRIAGDVPASVVGDEGRLRQVILNLVGNAVKFTETGEVLFEVGVEETTADEVVLRFCVTDTGIGIPRDKQQEIFGPFVQADASTTRRYGGTGLGLTISARLVELMGGRTWIESEPGQGTRFHFIARFGLPPVQADVRPPAIATLRDVRVLIVDDHATNRRILSEILSSWQIVSTAADGAAAALTILRDAADRGTPFHLVLSDVTMPEVDGFTLAAEIARDKQLRSTKVILLTSAGPGPYPRPVRGNHLEARLTKPVKQSDLLDAIATAFAAPAGGARSARHRRSGLGSRLGSRRVLVAEDNLTNQELLLALLEQRGDHVTVVSDGRQAVETSAAHPFDLILMDLQMPEMSGLDATAVIRAREGGTGHRLPIIALTAHAMSGDRERCLAAGMDGYVAKPLRPQELFDAMDQVCPRAATPARRRRSTAQRGRAPLVDRHTLLAAFGGQPSILAKTTGVFLADLPAMLEHLRVATACADLEAVAAVAHKIKGAAGLFSQGEAFTTAERLEQAAAARQTDAIDTACTDLRRALSALTAELQALLGS